MQLLLYSRLSKISESNDNFHLLTPMKNCVVRRTQFFLEKKISEKMYGTIAYGIIIDNTCTSLHSGFPMIMENFNYLLCLGYGNYES